MNPPNLKELAEQIAIPVSHLRYLLEQIEWHIPKATVWVFGSRVKWSHRPESDLDLAVLCDKETAKIFLPKLNDVFVESDLPFKVQLLDFNRLPENMQENIKKDYIVIYEPSKEPLPTDWKETTLGEVLGEKGYIRGPFGSSLRRNELSTEGIPVYEQQNAIYDNREFRYFIGNQKYEELSRFTVKEHDLIISCSGTIGRISIIKRDDPVGIISQALLILRPDTTKILPKYLYYFFSSAEGFNSLVSRSSGSVQVNIAERKIIQGIDLFLPSIPEQQAIIDILNSLDDKIELLRRQNKTLESIAQTIFKQWFVEFRIQNTEVRIDKKTGLPEGWRMGRLGEIIEIYGGGTPKTDIAEYWGGDIPWFSVVDVPSEGNIFVTKCEKHISQKGLDNSSTKILPVNTTIITARGTVGKLALVGAPMAMNQSCYGITPKDKISFFYIFLLMKESLVLLKQQVHGAVFDTITRDTLNNISVNIPSNKIIKLFEDTIKPCFQKVLKNNQQIQTLSKLRDTLLPKLMKGEIRVKFL